MRTPRFVSLALTTAVLCATTAFAQTPSTPGVDQRQQAQEQRIDQGQASGQLTAREARRLERQQARIQRAENTAKADGTVTAPERRRLHAKQDRASKHIHAQKHDRQVRGKRGQPGSGADNAPGA